MKVMANILLNANIKKIIILTVKILKSGNKYFIRYTNSNKMRIVPLQLKFERFYYETRNYSSGDNIIYIENSHQGFFEKMRKYGIKLLN